MPVNRIAGASATWARAGTGDTAPPDRGHWRDVRWWVVLAGTGVAAGVVAIVLTVALHGVQHLAFGYTEHSFLVGVEHASAARRAFVLCLAGAIGGLGWWTLQRRTRVITVPEALTGSGSRLPVVRTTADAALQIVVVGMGASLGREGAPRQVAAALGGWLAGRFGLSPSQRRVVIAAGAGAGLAAVYNVPVSGGLFASEVLLRSMAPGTLVPTAMVSAIATVTSWLVLPNQPTYPVGECHLSASLLVFAMVLGPLVGVAGRCFVQVMRRAGRRRAVSWRLVASCTAAFACLGGLASAYPQLLGNGKGPTELAFTGSLALITAAQLTILKPLATALCLRGGARGGLLTPALATGALFGAVTRHVWHEFWPAGSSVSFVLVVAGAMIAVTQRGPLCAVALIMEFTHTSLTLLVPLAIAAVGASVAGRSSRRVAKPADVLSSKWLVTNPVAWSQIIARRIVGRAQT